MDEILPDDQLTPEELVMRRKGEALAAKLEHRYRTDEKFRREFDEGFGQIAAGQVVVFSENEWEESCQ